MNKIEYAQEVASRFDGAEAKEVEKVNGIVQTGVIVGSGKVRTTIYIDKMYEGGLSPDDAAERIAEIAMENANTPDLPDFTDYESLKGKLRLRLYNEQTKAEIFRSAAPYGFDDLIIVPYVERIYETPEGNGSVKVTKQLLEIWGVTEHQLFEDAAANGEYIIQSMAEVLAALMGLPTDEEMMIPEMPMLVISNKDKIFGAYGVIALQRQLEEKFPSGYIVLPSSVHEVIVIPRDAGEMAEMAQMVQEVNASEVKPEEVLGHKAYEF